jgi:hypothetical protein
VTPERVKLTLTGQARMREEGRWFEGAVQERGFEASLLGYLAFDRRAERFTRFDVVAVGTRWGATTHSGRPNDFEPAPMGIAMTIAGKEARDRTAPHVSQRRSGMEWYLTGGEVRSAAAGMSAGDRRHLEAEVGRTLKEAEEVVAGARQREAELSGAPGREALRELEGRIARAKARLEAGDMAGAYTLISGALPVARNRIAGLLRQ